MAFKRTERVGPLILEEISTLLVQRLEDPRLKLVTFTKVKMSADLKTAHVYFSMIGTDEQISQAGKALAGAKGVFKRAMARDLDLRYLPELEFHHDKNPAYADRIERVIREIHQRDPKAKEDSDEAGD